MPLKPQLETLSSGVSDGTALGGGVPKTSGFKFHPWKSRDPLAAIVVFVLTVILLETAFSFLPKNSLVRSFHREQMSAEPAPEIQIMGDSVAQSGILAEQLAASLPDSKTIRNDAIAATGPEFSYFILKRKIDAGQAPKAVIYAPSPHTFTTLRVPLLIGAFCSWKEIFEIAATGMQPFDVLEGVLCKLSYTLRHRNELFVMLRQGRKKAAEPAGKLQTTVQTQETAATHRYTLENLHPQYKKRFKALDFNAVYFEKFLKLAREHNIRIYWVTMPVLQVVADCRKQFDFDVEYYGFLDGLTAAHGVELLQKEFLIYNENDFRDHIHLTEAAASRFTTLLGTKFAAVASAIPSLSADAPSNLDQFRER